MIIPYRAYGTKHTIFIRGHVLDDRLLYDSTKEDRKRKNFRAMISRYLSESIPDVRVQIKLFGHRKIVMTDKNGLFETVFQFEEPLQKEGWHPVYYKVLDKIVDTQEEVETEGEVYIQERSSSYGVISDVDDTILISHATQTLRKLRLILTKNSKTRLPFTGVAAFYEALRTGVRKGVGNPIFYVSSSEWNLYDFLEDFCEVRNIPKGPFLLQELKTSLWKLIKSGGGTHQHKLNKIRHLLSTFDSLPFILIGDSGQHDSELYAQACRDFPGRIKAIYIRDVSKSRGGIVLKAAGGIKDLGVDMLLVKDTAEAAQHAYENHFITAEELQYVIEETREQEERPESLVGQIVEKEQESP